MTIQESYEKTRSEYKIMGIDLKYGIGTEPGYYYEPTIVTYGRDRFGNIDHEHDHVQFIIHYVGSAKNAEV